MAFMTFMEDKKKARAKFIVLAIGILFLVVGSIFFLLDIATTGRFYDNLGIQQVLPRDGFNIYGGSAEGSLVGLALSGFQLYAGFRMAAAMLQKNRKEFNMWLVIRILTAIIDTYTDVDFRSFGLASLRLFVSSFVVSVFIYNVFSEWALTAGFGMIADNWAFIFPFLAELWRTMGSAKDFIDKVTKPAEEKEHKPDGGGGHKAHPPFPGPTYNPVRNMPPLKRPKVFEMQTRSNLRKD